MYEVYFATTMTLNEFAVTLRSFLNLRDRNATPHQLEQRREGINLGGTYYLFEVLGLELVLVSNGGEVAIPERLEYPYYLIVRGGSDLLSEVIARQICSISRENGIDAVVDSLSA